MCFCRLEPLNIIVVRWLFFLLLFFPDLTFTYSKKNTQKTINIMDRSISALSPLELGLIVAIKKCADKHLEGIFLFLFFYTIIFIRTCSIFTMYHSFPVLCLIKKTPNNILQKTYFQPSTLKWFTTYTRTFRGFKTLEIFHSSKFRRKQ